MYRTPAQINNLMRILASWYPQYFNRVELPERSVEGQPIYALRLRFGNEGERRGVLMVGGTHARELMNPDALLELAVDLLVSHATNSDLVYGGRTWTASEVEVMVETLELWFLPCVNPDGRDHVLTVDDMWRKNRRNNPGSVCDGVDLNRNADLLWGVTEGRISCSPCSDVYCGPSAFSEPESRNVKFLLDTKRVDCFVDVHSYSELILYPWGHAPTQSTDPAQRFTTLPSGTCSPIADPTYAEYMPPRDVERFETVADRIVADIAAVQGRAYTPQTGIALYATTGTHGDYPYSRHIANPSLRKTYSFTFETGPWQGNSADSFHPDDPEPVKLDAKAGLVSLIQQCVCAIERIGNRFFDGNNEVAALRRVRDDLLATTDAGQEWIGLFERVQTPLLSVVLADKRLTKQAVQLVRRAASLVADDGGRMSSADVKKALATLEQLAERADDRQLAGDLKVVSKRLEKIAKEPTRGMIESLMKDPPRKRKQRG